MKGVIYQEAVTPNKKVKVGILIYTGAGDPVKHLNEAVHNYVRNEGYNEFIDANMDNPWVRVIIKGMNEMEKVEFIPEIHHL
jgi:hypothetical protein